MNTKNSSNRLSTVRRKPPLPRLERLLLDEDVDLIEVEPYLRALGFTTKSALLVEPPLIGDIAILRYARRYRWILVCHDKHEPERKRRSGKEGGKPTPEGWFTELAVKGGRVIEIEGGNQQPSLEAVGKLIKHRHEWLAFFEGSSGAVLVHKNGMTRKGPERLLRELGTRLTLKEQLPEAPPRIKAPQRKRRRSRKPIPGAELTPRFSAMGGG